MLYATEDMNKEFFDMFIFLMQISNDNSTYSIAFNVVLKAKDSMNQSGHSNASSTLDWSRSYIRTPWMLQAARTGIGHVFECQGPKEALFDHLFQQSKCRRPNGSFTKNDFFRWLLSCLLNKLSFKCTEILFSASLIRLWHSSSNHRVKRITPIHPW